MALARGAAVFCAACASNRPRRSRRPEAESLDPVAGAVTDQLARRAEAAQLGAPIGADGPVGRLLTRRLRHGRLDALEAGFSRWADRRASAWLW